MNPKYAIIISENRVRKKAAIEFTKHLGKGTQG